MFGFKVKVLSVVVATIATLAQVDVGPEVFVSHESGLLNNKPEDVFKFLGESVYVPKWFGWVSSFKEADKQAFGLDKKFQASFNFPIVGEVTTLLVVTEFVPGRRVVLEGASGLMPRLEVDVEPADAAGVRPGVNPAAPDSSSIRGSNLSFKLSFRRSSALFQFSVSPLLSFLAGHQLRRSILMLRMMIP
jgi:hypothetical protein